MHDSTLDLFEQQEEEQAKRFAEWASEKAKELGVTEEYFQMEFL